MNVLPPGWEVPDALPAGVTVAPAADPHTAARVIAERVGGEIVVDVAAAERALAREASRRRAERVVADAAEAARLLSLLEGSDPAADRALLATAPAQRPAAAPSSAEAVRLAGIVGDLVADAVEVRAAAARLRVAELTAASAAALVGARPVEVLPDIELVRARSLAACAEADAARAADDAAGLGSTSTGALAVSVGATLMLVASGVGIETAACVPTLVGAASVRGWRRRRTDAARLRGEAEDAVAGVDRAREAKARADAAVRAWEARNDAAVVAAAELDDARRAWIAIAGDVAVERADRVADALDRLATVREALGLAPDTPPSQVAFECRRAEQEIERSREEAAAARAREEARARLREVLHGRPLQRLQADAAAARAILATPAPAALVLCDPFVSIGPGRRRALLHDLERAGDEVTLALVTSDEEALAWAQARTRAHAAPSEIG